MNHISTTNKNTQRKIANWLILSGVIGPVGLAICIILAGILRPGYSPIRQAVSDLGTQSYAWLLNIPLIFCGLLIALFAFCFYQLASQLPGRRLISILFGVFGILFGSAGIFHAPGVHGSGGIGGFLHYFLGLFLGVPILLIGLFKAGSQIRKYTTSQKYGWYTTITAWTILIEAPIMFVFFNRSSPLYKVGIGGLLERVLFIIFLSWIITTSILLFKRKGFIDL